MQHRRIALTTLAILTACGSSATARSVNTTVNPFATQPGTSSPTGTAPLSTTTQPGGSTESPTSATSSGVPTSADSTGHTQSPGGGATPTTLRPTTVQPTTTIRSTTTTRVTIAPQVRVFSATSDSGTPPTFRANLGDTIRLTVISGTQQDEEFHVHDYDIPLGGTRVVFEFVADIAGTHVVESHTTQHIVCYLVVT